MDIAPFPLLKDASSYHPCTFDMLASPPSDAPNASDWIEVFRASLQEFVRRAKESTLQDGGGSDACIRAIEFSRDYEILLDAYAEDASNARIPDWLDEALPSMNCIHLCRLREKALRAHGFGDVFRQVKESQNDEAIKMLPHVLDRLDACQDTKQKMDLLLRGLLAGNAFDLGAATSALAFRDGNDISGAAGSFFESCERLPDRPWILDDVDAFLSDWCDESAWSFRHVKAILFMDNAGADAILGTLPFARELLKRGMQVLLAANSKPSINDITAKELRDVLERAGGCDEALRSASSRLRVVDSGNDLPVIDLSRVSDELAWEARDADLVVLLGMGRAIETNLYADMGCDCLRVARIKHKEVAQLLQGEVFGCVVRWTNGEDRGF